QTDCAIGATSSGIAYTRDGRFTINPEGELATLIGARRLTPTVVIPHDATSITVDDTGQVYVFQQGQIEPQLVGAIRLTSFSAPEFLRPFAGNLYVPTPACGPAIAGTPGENGIGTIVQGMYEGSNVDPRTEQMEIL